VLCCAVLCCAVLCCAVVCCSAGLFCAPMGNVNDHCGLRKFGFKFRFEFNMGRLFKTSVEMEDAI
jgi:hypothetical protein